MQSQSTVHCVRFITGNISFSEQLLSLIVWLNQVFTELSKCEVIKQPESHCYNFTGLWCLNSDSIETLWNANVWYFRWVVPCTLWPHTSHASYPTLPPSLRPLARKPVKVTLPVFGNMHWLEHRPRQGKGSLQQVYRKFTGSLQGTLLLCGGQAVVLAGR